MNGRQIHRLLARMTDYVETRSGMASRYAEYAQRGSKGYEIEHIWADHPERHRTSSRIRASSRSTATASAACCSCRRASTRAMATCRTRRSASTTVSQNLLAQSLHEQAYEHNPGFLRFIEESGLPFRAAPEFRKADLDARQALYQRLAEQIWNPESLMEEAAS